MVSSLTLLYLLNPAIWLAPLAALVAEVFPVELKALAYCAIVVTLLPKGTPFLDKVSCKWLSPAFTTEPPLIALPKTTPLMLPSICCRSWLPPAIPFLTPLMALPLAPNSKLVLREANIPKTESLECPTLTSLLSTDLSKECCWLSKVAANFVKDLVAEFNSSFCFCKALISSFASDTCLSLVSLSNLSLLFIAEIDSLCELILPFIASFFSSKSLKVLCT